MFKRTALGFTPLFVIATVAGCQSNTEPTVDGDGPSDASAGRDSSVPSQIARHFGALSGLVVDVHGNRVSGAAVQAGALTVETDEAGEFDFDQVAATDHETLIVTRDGYSTGRLPLTVLEAFPNHVRVTLQHADIAMLADPSAGGEVQSESGVTFKLAPGQIVDENGNAVTDPVEIVIALINDRDEMAAAPGGMMALDPDAEEDTAPTQLESFGMVEVSMTAAGETVHLAEGSEVELEFPLAPQHPFSQGDTVGLWHFDEGEDVWKNDGNGTVTSQNKMKSLVGHFSWWNADQVMTKTCVLGRVLDASGHRVRGANIHGEGRSYLGSSYAMTDEDGEFCLEARVSSVVDVSTLVRVGREDQALAVRVTTPRTLGNCGQPSTCYMLPEDLVAVAEQQLCDPAQCPADPGGKEACCISDLGPCSFVVNGDCGGSEDGSWDEPADEPGVSQIPGVPTGTIGTTDSGTRDGGTVEPIDAGTTTDAGTVEPMDASITRDAGDTGNGGQGGQGGGGQGGQGADAGTAGSGGQGTADASADGAPACSGSFYSPCMDCLRARCDGEVSACMGAQWDEGSFGGVCQSYGQCLCENGSDDSTCDDSRYRTPDCQTCMDPVFACASTLCSLECGSGEDDGGTAPDGGYGGGGYGGYGSGGYGGFGGGGYDGGVGGYGGFGGLGGGGGFGGGGGQGGSGSPPVDRCADAIAIGLGTTEGSTVGSQLATDWYDGQCNRFLPGFERTYSLEIAPGATLRARVLGAGMNVQLSHECFDINGTCQASGSSLSFSNYGETPKALFLTVDNAKIDHQAPFTLLLTTEQPTCGDGFVDRYYEACDDGGNDDADGCSASCQVEPNWVCPDDMPCHPIVCGDGFVDGTADGRDPGPVDGGMYDGGYGDGGAGSAPDEQCDDGDTDPDDGCDPSCQIESGYACEGSPSVCAQRPAGDLCSNSLPLAPGSWDLADFNADYYFFGPDLVFSTHIPSGQVLLVSGTAGFDGSVALTYASRCGEGMWFSHALEAGQPFSFGFDPGELYSPEGIGGDMRLIFSAMNGSPETTLTIDSATVISPVCGDGVITPSNGEQCDDGGPVEGDGCDLNCQVEDGYVCDGPGPCRAAVCGDGRVDWPAENCEDGGTATGDGCGSDCRTEPGWLCDPMFESCEMRLAGDLCNNAEMLPADLFQNSYDLSSMTADVLDCSGCDITRWFAVQQQPGEVTTVMIVADFSGYVSYVTPACPVTGGEYPSGGMGGGGFGDGSMHHSSVTNYDDEPRTLWLRVSASFDEPAGTFELITKTGPQGCGDGVRDSGYGGGEAIVYTDEGGQGPSEECDDLNNASGDGCSPDCQREFGPYRCPYQGGPCTAAVCGDGMLDDATPGVPHEECDDGGTADDDGCDASCRVEDGALCSGYPSTCQMTPAGDVCSNALALTLETSSHSLVGFHADPRCEDTCYGNDMWFTRVLAPREVFDATVTADSSAVVRLYGADSGSCRERYQLDSASDYYSSATPLHVHAENDTPQPITLFLAVAGYGDQGSFELTASSEVPALDCSQQPCVPVVCSDGVVDGNEQCDDDETLPADGCSADCVVESGFSCAGEPSTCQALPPGDSCEQAEQLADDTYSLAGYSPDARCDVSCDGATRWFEVDVPAYHTLALTADAPGTSNVLLRMFRLNDGPCHQLGLLQFDLGLSYGEQRVIWLNDSSQPVRWAVAVFDAAAYPSTASFTIAHTVEPVGCGDSYFDRYGSYGLGEGCDDGNAVGSDGCSATCQPEPGWDCGDGPCVQVVCGDALINGDEQCDDGEALPGDGCSDSCMVEPGYVCSSNAPSRCDTYRSDGDLCENAIALADDTYSMAGYIPDLSCDDTCSGVDRWFAVEVPAGHTLFVRAASSDMTDGYINAWDASNGCDDIYPVNPGQPFSAQNSGGFAWVNQWTEPRSIRIAVLDQQDDPSSGSFELEHTLVPTGCGDSYIDTYGYYGPNEVCDDGNTTGSDGCGSSCQVEPGYVCFGMPSVCFVPPPGDECSTAQPLVDGPYDLAGYSSGFDCSYGCSSVDRWLTVTVPANQMLELNASTTASLAHLTLWVQNASSCDAMTYLTGSNLFEGNPQRLYWHNDDGASPATIALQLDDPMNNPSYVQFDLTHRTFVPYCGDGYLDSQGNYGPPEACDDNNNLPSDGCDPSCNWEP